MEQWQIADHALDILKDPLTRPLAAVAVKRGTISGLYRDVYLIGIALAAINTLHLKAMLLGECIEQCQTPGK